MKKLIVFATLAMLSFGAQADEGMWLPLFIKRLNYEDMRQKGLRLTAEEIYSVNQSSLKDAIVSLNSGSCTAEMISKDGLMLTNHHCGYASIQSHSTVENDYLTHGFWAMKRSDEKMNAKLTASFLVRMEDVTQQVLAQLGAAATEEERKEKLTAITEALEKKAVEGTGYTASVKDFFDGNEFYLFVYEVFKDVRLVGAPPSSIGKFGGDTDNWMWPRHTGDFSLFRVYTGKDGKPAEYSPDNIPMKPKHHLPVYLGGVGKNDFTMVFGFPGTTDRYLTSQGVKMAIEQSNPARVKVREEKLALMKEDMDASDKVRIQYSSKYYQISNYWKYFIGQTQGLKRLKVYDQKKAEEAAFADWVNKDPKRKAKYGSVMADLDKGYVEKEKYNLASIYMDEAAVAPEIIMFAYEMASSLSKMGDKSENGEKVDEEVKELKEKIKEHFKDYNAPTDQKILAAMMQMYAQNINPSMHPALFKEVQTTFGGDYNRFAADVFAKSALVSQEKTESLLSRMDLRELQKDAAFRVMASYLQNYFQNVIPGVKQADAILDAANRLYVAGIREMHQDKKYYPNANSTLRLTYGSVQDYRPKDAVQYDFITTLEGIMEKEDSTSEEFTVPAKLKALYQKRDYGRYGANGAMPVAFITNNDITGGNSGSPVIDGSGRLVGVAFDGNWEAMSGDIAYDPQYKRCINVDIRYVLFIIDKYANARHLIDEMTIVEAKNSPATEPKPKTKDRAPVPAQKAAPVKPKAKPVNQ